jgi:hypothetical protein
MNALIKDRQVLFYARVMFLKIIVQIKQKVPIQNSVLPMG